MQRAWQTLLTSASKGQTQGYGLRMLAAGPRALCGVDRSKSASIGALRSVSCFRPFKPGVLSHRTPFSSPVSISVQHISSLLRASCTQQAVVPVLAQGKAKFTFSAASVTGGGYISQSRALLSQPRMLPGRDTKKRIGAKQRRLSTIMGGGGSQWNSSWWWNENLINVIIGCNVVVWVLWQNVRLRKFLNDNFTISTRGILKEGRLHTIFTCLFSHKDLMHLIANMVTLWFFGTEAVMLLGAQRFLNLFMFGGVTASVCQVMWPLAARQLPIPAQFRTSPHQQGLGASGAINAVVAYSILTFPSRTVYLYMFLPVPAALLGALFLAKDVSGLYYGDSPYGNAAHLGGSLFGLAFWLRFRSLTPRW